VDGQPSAAPDASHDLAASALRFRHHAADVQFRHLVENRRERVALGGVPVGLKQSAQIAGPQLPAVLHTIVELNGVAWL
jgi:hypothetical protein